MDPRFPLDTGHTVLPIFAANEKGHAHTFRGTGFLIAPRLLLTCWHCVLGPLPPGHQYVVCFQPDSSHATLWAFAQLRDVEQDRGGSDLATATVDLSPDVELKLGKEPRMGEDVFAVGFPLTEPPSDSNPRFMVSRRYLQGYITRGFNHTIRPGSAPVPSFELDMKAPAGLSGAPLIRARTNQVVGVIYGEHSVARIEEAASIDPDTGVRTPEVQRLVSFGLAHLTRTVEALSTRATQGKPLATARTDGESAA